MKFVLLALLLLACGSVATKAQSCVTQEDVRQMLARVEAPAPASPDKKLKDTFEATSEALKSCLKCLLSNASC